MAKKTRIAAKPHKSIPERIVESVASHNGTTSLGLLASDLGLDIMTVKQHLVELQDRIEVGWDGVALQLSDAEQRARSAINPMDMLLARLNK